MFPRPTRRGQASQATDGGLDMKEAGDRGLLASSSIGVARMQLVAKRAVGAAKVSLSEFRAGIGEASSGVLAHLVDVRTRSTTHAPALQRATESSFGAMHLATGQLSVAQLWRRATSSAASASRWNVASVATAGTAGRSTARPAQ